MLYDNSVFRFIPSLIRDTYRYTEVADGYYVTAKQKGQVQIKMCDNNGDHFMAMFHKVLLAPDLCDRLSSNITLIICYILVYSKKGFCTV